MNSYSVLPFHRIWGICGSSLGRTSKGLWFSASAKGVTLSPMWDALAARLKRDSPQHMVSSSLRTPERKKVFPCVKQRGLESTAFKERNLTMWNFTTSTDLILKWSSTGMKQNQFDIYQLHTKLTVSGIVHFNKAEKSGLLLFKKKQHGPCQWAVVSKLGNWKLNGNYAFPKTRCRSHESINSTIWKNTGPMPANVQIKKVFTASKNKLEVELEA